MQKDKDVHVQAIHVFSMMEQEVGFAIETQSEILPGTALGLGKRPR